MVEARQSFGSRFACAVPVAGVALALMMLLPSADAAAQEFPGMGGVDARFGLANPVDGDVGVSAGLDFDLGFVDQPGIRALIGLDFFHGGVNGELAGGSYDALGARVGARGDLIRVGDVRPYVVGALTGHSVKASVPGDPPLEAALDGFYIGAQLAAGAFVSLDPEQRFGVTGEVRRNLINNIGHWAFEGGVRWNPRGPDTYRSDDDIVAERRRRAAEERRRQVRDARDPAGQVDDPEAGEDRTVEERRREAERRRDEERRRAVGREGDWIEAGDPAGGLRGGLVELDRRMQTSTGVRETDEGWVVGFGSGFFQDGRYALGRAGRDDLTRLAGLLRQHPEVDVRVEAAAPPEAGVEGRRTAERRAEAVRAVLVAEGLDPFQVEAAAAAADAGADPWDPEVRDRMGADPVTVHIRSRDAF